MSQAKHNACIGTQIGITCRKLAFTHSREGFRRFEQTLRDHLVKNSCRRLVIAMEPSGIYWQGLYDRLRSCGYDVCLVSCQAVHNNRKTMQEAMRKTDEKDAYSVLDLLRQGEFFLPVARDAELQAAYRLMHHHMALKKRVSQLRNQLRAAILRHGRQRFLEAWQPRQRCGQWRSQKFQQLYELAQHSIGLIDPYRLDEFEIPALAHDLTDALAKQQLWLDHAIALLEPRPDFQLLLQLPRIGAPTAAAILTAIGDIGQYGNGKQLVKLAGLDVRLCESGSSIRKLPKISHVGSAYLRHWLYHYALRLVAHDPHFRAYYQRRKQQSPGKGAGQRVLMAVCDKTIRMLYRILTDHAPYDPKKDKSMTEYYAAQRKAASRGRRALEGLSGEGKPGCAFGLRRDGENPSVSAGPSPLHETRTKNRRSTPTGKPEST